MLGASPPARGRDGHPEGVANEAELDSEALERLVDQFLALSVRLPPAPPEGTIEQIAEAAQAVYKSWDAGVVREYRRLNRLEGLQAPPSWFRRWRLGIPVGIPGLGAAPARPGHRREQALR